MNEQPPAPEWAGKLPRPVFGCHICSEDYSWPAKYLNWSALAKEWICGHCWDHQEHGEPGISLETALTAHAPDVTSQWQPIATAPMDGTRILGWSKGCNVNQYYWNSVRLAWMLDYTGGYPWQPTHWQPLPPPPGASTQPAASESIAWRKVTRFSKTGDGSLILVLDCPEGVSLDVYPEGVIVAVVETGPVKGIYEFEVSEISELVELLQSLDATRKETPDAHSQGLCATTLTERFKKPACRCKTYEGNLGPCKTSSLGENGNCAYCDHEETCHSDAR